MNKKGYLLSFGGIVVVAGVAIAISFAIPNKYKRGHEYSNWEEQQRLENEQNLEYIQKWSLPIEGLEQELNKLYPNLNLTFVESNNKSRILDNGIMVTSFLKGKDGTVLENKNSSLLMARIDVATGAFERAFVNEEFRIELEKINIRNDELSKFIIEQVKKALASETDEVKMHYSAIDIYK